MPDPTQMSAAATPADSPERLKAESGWLLQLARRDASAPQALEHLRQAYGHKVLAFCVRRGMPAADIEELLQELWMRVYEHAHRFEQGRTPSTWVWAIARNLWHDAMRELYKKRDEDGNSLEEGLSEAAEEVAAPACESPAQAADECVQRGLHAFGRGHPDEATVIYLRHLEGWAIAEVAHYLERTEGATRQFLSQVRKKLAPFLEPCLELLPN